MRMKMLVIVVQVTVMDMVVMAGMIDGDDELES